MSSVNFKVLTLALFLIFSVPVFFVDSNIAKFIFGSIALYYLFLFLFLIALRRIENE